ncbi:hypothetical protein EJ04DRAFT_596758 [Polyplosphaeria fusca]|uniref:Uncharacterized protein n=1 Tax=Polyplosphaeria fusca TaxID=682080 RepID=A0A9P4QK31_9PLEO|nr:hypothetical protein EJ04DRAFT_596758 [Polyplosphaeria fusca]
MFELIARHMGDLPSRKQTHVMMATATFFKKTEPRDSVFAILGLIKSEKEAEDLLKPDYTKPLADVLRDATRFSLFERWDLSALTFIRHPSDKLKDLNKFPTWTIRADLPSASSIVDRLPAYFFACRGLKPPSLLSDVSSGPNILLLEGFIVDRVVETAALVQDAWNDSKELQAWALAVKNMVLKHSTQPVSGDIYLDVAYAVSAAQSIDGQRVQEKICPYSQSMYGTWMSK